ncbi:MAG: thioredoxin family protein [Polyangiales bacterium]
MRVALSVCALSLALFSCKRSEAVSGCGPALEPASEQWVERSDAELSAKIHRAMQCGQRRGTRVLLEFTAPWCTDCREMARIEAQEPAQSVLAERFERVRVNVKRWDAHRALVERYGIRAIAAYVALDPRTGAVLAQTTQEPITGTSGAITSERWAAWLRSVR